MDPKCTIVFISEFVKNVNRYKIRIHITYYNIHVSPFSTQVRSQTEGRKPGLQHHIGLDARSPDFVACEQQRRRPACASAQSDLRLCYSLSKSRVPLILHVLVGFNMIEPLATPLLLNNIQHLFDKS